MTKEQIYDDQVNPLIVQILEICKVNRIAMIADFALDAVDFHCTSALLSPEFEPLDTQLGAWEILKPRGGTTFALAETIETLPGGEKKITIQGIS